MYVPSTLFAYNMLIKLSMAHPWGLGPTEQAGAPSGRQWAINLVFCPKDPYRRAWPSGAGP